MYSDFHIHTHHSPDSDEIPENIIKKCIELGMSECCFTDHNDFNWPDPNENYDLDIKAYYDELISLRELYKNKIDICIGVECGITDDNYIQNLQLIKNNPFDFVIGSCHIVGGMDPYYPDFFDNRNDREAFEGYFTTLKKSLEYFDNFDVLGHLDYIVRYSPNKDANYSALDYMDIIDEILIKLIHSGKGIEINSSGLKSGLPFANPCPEILKRYKELGGEIITMGSDAHNLNFVGFKFDVAAQFLKNAGFNNYCIYKKRKPLFKSL